MSLFDKMERGMGRNRNFPNLMWILAGAYALGYLVCAIYPGALEWIVFDPYLISKGQVWRLISFIFYPNGSSVFLVFITCFIYFSIANSLEQIIGRFRLNFFLVSGLVLLLAFGFLYYLIFPLPYRNNVICLNPYYLYPMLFVLFAMIYPNARFLLMFIIPIRGKWMIFITLALYLVDVLRIFLSGNTELGWMIVFMIAAAILALVLFILLSSYKFGKIRNTSNTVRMQAYRKATENTGGKKARHKCAICGRTELTNPELDFRYCTKCIGNYEYCNEHLYTHTHVGSSGRE